MRYGPHRSLNTRMVRVRVWANAEVRIRSAVPAGTAPSGLEKSRSWDVSNSNVVQEARGSYHALNPFKTDVDVEIC